MEKNEVVKALLCPACKTTVDDDAEFCGNCGFKIAQNKPPASVVCSNCGALIQNNAEFCNNCGAMTAAFSLTPPIPPQTQPMQQSFYRQPRVTPGFAAHVRAEEERKKKNRRTFWIVFSSVLGGIILIVLLILLLSRCSMDYTPSYVPDNDSQTVQRPEGNSNNEDNNGGGDQSSLNPDDDGGGESANPEETDVNCPCGGTLQQGIAKYLDGTTWVDTGRRLPYDGALPKYERFREYADDEFDYTIFEFDILENNDTPKFSITSTFVYWGAQCPGYQIDGFNSKYFNPYSRTATGNLTTDTTILTYDTFGNGQRWGVYLYVCDSELYVIDFLEDEKYDRGEAVKIRSNIKIYRQIEYDTTPLEDYLGYWKLIGEKYSENGDVQLFDTSDGAEYIEFSDTN